MPDSTAESTSKTRDASQRLIPPKSTNALLSEKDHLEPAPYTEITITRLTVVNQWQVVANSSRKQASLESRFPLLVALMWKITTHDFTLQEVLIMAATNVESALIATDKSERTTDTAPWTEIQQVSGDCHGKSN
jgi:hypothetical protein